MSHLPPRDGTYIPPDFEPQYQPSTATDTPDGNLKANTSTISHYELLDTGTLYTTEAFGDETAAYMFGAQRSEFTSAPRTFVPPCETDSMPIQGLPGKEGESTALLKQLYNPTVMKMPETQTHPVQQSSQRGIETGSFRGPDLALQFPAQPPPEYGDIDDTVVPVSANAVGGGMNGKQPSWPPRFIHEHDIEEHQDNPSGMQQLPVYSMSNSGVSSQSHGGTAQSRCSDAGHSPGRIPVMQGGKETKGTGTGGMQPRAKQSIFGKLFGCFS